MSVLPQRLSIYKRTNGIFYIGFRDQNGRRKWRSTSCTTKPEALKAVTEFRELLSKRIRSVPLSQFFSQFSTFAETTYSQRTREIYQLVMGRFLGMFPNAFLSDLTPENIDSYKAKRLREVSPVTVHLEMRALRSLFNTARRWKLLKEDICEGVSLPQLPEKAPLALTVQDFQKLIDSITETWLKDLVIFAVLTGLRRGELLSLKWGNVDFSRKLIHIETGAGFHTKAGKRRTIPLSDAAFALLNTKHGKSVSEFVFTLNDKPIFEDWVTHLFKRYVRKLNLNPRYKFHSLRHSHASLLVQAGVPIYTVQKLLGHSSVKVTEGYSHLPADELREAVNKLPVALN